MEKLKISKGQDYISLFADLDAGRVLFATPGRDATTVGKFAADLAEHGGDPERVHTTSSDMSKAFIAGIGEHLPNAQLTFDRYHLAAKLSEAVDAVRRAEIATRPELKHTRWLWLKNWSNLTTKQRRELQQLMRPVGAAGHRARPALAGGLPSVLRPTSQLRSRVPARLVLRRQTLPPATDQGLRRPGPTALGRHHRLARISCLERTARRTNSLIQAAKARARGYRNKAKMIIIAYLIAGKLPLPTVTNPAAA